MAHDWKEDPKSGTYELPFQTWRECTRCGARQEKTDHQRWGRVTHYSWYPLVGRCPKDKKPAARGQKPQKPAKTTGCAWPIGDCFAFATNEAAGLVGATVVHGTVTHPWDGYTLPHAWIEVGGRVWDWQGIVLRKTRPAPKHDWYAQWKPTNMSRYTPEQAVRLAVQYGHYGPYAPVERKAVKEPKRQPKRAR